MDDAPAMPDKKTEVYPKVWDGLTCLGFVDFVFPITDNTILERVDETMAQPINAINCLDFSVKKIDPRESTEGPVDKEVKFRLFVEPI